MSDQPSTTRSLFEVALGFLGALLIIPLVVKGTVGAIRGLLRLRIVRRLAGEAIIVGLTTLLTREDVLDLLFGKKKRDTGELETTSASSPDES